jgi:hypothetical protein
MIKKHHQAERLLEIDNVHVPGCGTPPAVDAAGRYVSYFENSYGEQFVFLGDRQKKTAVVYGGDIGWDNAIAVSVDEPCPDVILNDQERAWLLGCLAVLADCSFEEMARRHSKAANELAKKLARELAKKDDES